MKKIQLIFNVFGIYFCICNALAVAEEVPATISPNTNISDRNEAKPVEDVQTLEPVKTEYGPHQISATNLPQVEHPKNKKQIIENCEEHILFDDTLVKLGLPKNYNKMKIPKHEGLGVSVNVYLNIRSVAEIDEVNEKISLEMDTVIQWDDDGLLHESDSNKNDSEVNDPERKDNPEEDVTEENDSEEDDLKEIDSEEDVTEKNDPKEVDSEENVSDEDDPEVDEFFNQETLDPILLSKIWKPDIYLNGLVDVKNPEFITRPATLKLSKGGLVTYNSRLIVKLDCGFDFTYYPADTQKCHIILRSYSYNIENLSLFWLKPGAFLMKLEDNNFDLALSRFRRYKLVTPVIRPISYDDENLIKNDTYYALQFTLSARRRISYQLVQTYLPSMLYVGITWLCFMIPSRMIEARIAITMTTLLTLTAMFASVRENTPVVSYIKAIDYWMAACIFFVFFILLEFTMLLWTGRVNEDREKKQEEHDFDIRKNKQNEKAAGIGQKIKNKLRLKCTILITFFESYSFILILLVFIIFNTVYWSWLMVNSEYFLWHVEPDHNALVENHIVAEKIIEESDDIYNRDF